MSSSKQNQEVSCWSYANVEKFVTCKYISLMHGAMYIDVVDGMEFWAITWLIKSQCYVW